MTSGLPQGKKMWMRSFYGFDPEEDGYAGWTKESGRTRILKQINDGDLLMIYGAGTKETEKALRSYVLGSRLIDPQGQNMMVAARATADRKVLAHLS